MVDGQGSMGYMSPSCGMTICERMCYLIGKNVCIYFPEGAPVRGTLRGVGSDYLEVHRMRDNEREVVIIPFAAISSVAGPADRP